MGALQLPPKHPGNLEGPISQEQAIEIADQYFKPRGEFGTCIEDRGDWFFVTPPYIFRKDAERAGVWVAKGNGTLTTRCPKP